jgi:hypothetical protein
MDVVPAGQQGEFAAPTARMSQFSVGLTGPMGDSPVFSQ